MAEIAASCAWWEEDNIVSHILTTCLASAVFSILPYADDDRSLARRTACTVYNLLRQLYSVHDHTSSSALYSELCNLHCGGRVLEYVTKWRAGITHSVAMAIADVFSKNGHTVPNKIAKVFKIFDRLETPKSRWVIP